MLALKYEKKIANSFRNIVSRVEQTNIQIDRQTDRPTLNFINVDDITNIDMNMHFTNLVFIFYRC